MNALRLWVCGKCGAEVSSPILAEQHARRCGPMRERRRIESLALEFPSLRLPHVEGVEPFDAIKLDRWASGPAPSSGQRHAARFVLSVYNNLAEWECGKFEIALAVGVWDAAHVRAFAEWAREPWLA